MTAAIANGDGDYLAIVERLSRLKTRESEFYARGMVILEMLRDHRVSVRATVPQSGHRRGDKGR